MIEQKHYCSSSFDATLGDILIAPDNRGRRASGYEDDPRKEEGESNLFDSSATG